MGPSSTTGIRAKRDLQVFCVECDLAVHGRVEASKRSRWSPVNDDWGAVVHEAADGYSDRVRFVMRQLPLLVLALMFTRGQCAATATATAQSVEWEPVVTTGERLLSIRPVCATTGYMTLIVIPHDGGSLLSNNRFTVLGFQYHGDRSFWVAEAYPLPPDKKYPPGAVVIVGDIPERILTFAQLAVAARRSRTVGLRATDPHSRLTDDDVGWFVPPESWTNLGSAVQSCLWLKE